MNDEDDGSEFESAGFLEKFGRMQTLDHEELLTQMLLLGGENLNSLSARFYLEMNNWNLQRALCSYFDLQNSGGRLPSMTFLGESESEAVEPNCFFTKTWRIRNSGPEPWPIGSSLKCTAGTLLSTESLVIETPLAPFEKLSLSIQMRAPKEIGLYESLWRMSTPWGSFFGDPIYVILSVENNYETSAVTEAMAEFHSLGFVPHEHMTQNPFSLHFDENNTL